MGKSIRVILCLACMGIAGFACYYYATTVVPKRKRKSISNKVSNSISHKKLFPEKSDDYDFDLRIQLWHVSFINYWMFDCWTKSYSYLLLETKHLETLQINKSRSDETIWFCAYFIIVGLFHV